jgi:hypothetical protein
MTSQPKGRAASAVVARRRLAVRVGLKIAGAAVLDFVLLRIWVPDLINRHNDWALAGAIAGLAAALAVGVWLVVQLWSDRSRWARLDPRAAPGVVEWRDR